MGFLSGLGKIGGLIGGIAGAPFTGGASLLPTILGGVGAASSVLGKQQEGKAAGANQQAQTQQAQDRNALALYQAQQQAQNTAAQTDLDRQRFASGEQGRNAKNALISALLGGGIAPTRVNVPGITPASISGGMLASLKNNPEALASLAMLKGQANTALEKGPSFTGGEMVKPPTLTPLPDLGKGNGFLNTLANIGQIAGSVSPFLKGSAPQAPPMPYGYTAGLSDKLPGVDLGIPMAPDLPKKRPVYAEDESDYSNR